MDLKKILSVVIFLSIFFIKVDDAKSQDLIINNNMDSIHCKILAVKGKYYYYNVFKDLKTQQKIIHQEDIRDTIRNYFPYTYNRDSAFIVEQYNAIVNQKRIEKKIVKLGINYGYSTTFHMPGKIALFNVLYQKFELPHNNSFKGLSLSWIFYKNIGIVGSASNMTSSFTGEFSNIGVVPASTINGKMDLNHWNYNIGLSYISATKRFPKCTWQLNAELGYYKFQSTIDYLSIYKVSSEAISWRNSAIIEYAILKNINIGLSGFLQISRHNKFEVYNLNQTNTVENTDGSYSKHLYFGTLLSLSYLLYKK